MQNRKIRILGIAPYKSLMSSMNALAASYENIELVTYVGDLDAGVALAKQYMNDDFDILISRGGTASLIKEFSTIPVIEIPLTIYDIIRTLKLTSESSTSCAIVGFPNITIPAKIICDLLHYDMKINTIRNQAEARQMLMELKKNGYEYILCDTVTESLARESGMNPVLIVSGHESIQSAFEEALKICSFTGSMAKRCAVLEESLQMQSSKTIILRKDKSIFFSNYNAGNISIVMPYLMNLVTESLDSTSIKAFHLIDNSLYSLTYKKVSFDAEELYVFNIVPNPIPTGSSKYGLHFTSYSDMVDMYTKSFYARTASSKVLESKLATLSASHLPIMIQGERGTGKNQIAAKIFIESPLKNNPYIIIDCPLINDKNWNYITNHFNSPLFDKNNTIFISNIQDLSEVRQHQLVSLILDTNVHKRNQLIFSCSQTLMGNAVDLSDLFIKHLSCMTINLPPLRELSSDIESASNLYLNDLNIELAKQVVGFEPEAMQLLRSYSWPENFLQLKRVLTDLVLFSTTQYIQPEAVQEILDKERRHCAPLSFDNFDYDRPLYEMIHDIAKVVLQKCDGNQTKAAKQLGIGRTTLWRYLNSDSE